MKKPKPLDHTFLRKKLDATQLEFKTTSELKPVNESVGQERALQAILFGIGIQNQGYNLYVMGPSGLGKLSFVTKILDSYAPKSQTPSDWCYIHNFDAPDKPTALELPPGVGIHLQQDMKKLVATLGTRILAVLESDEYNYAMKKITNEYNRKRKKFSKKNLTENMDVTPQLYKEQHAKEKELQRRLVSNEIKPIIDKLKKHYAKLPDVTKYLRAVKKDIVHHVNDFIKTDEKTNALTFSLENTALIKYKVNLIVDNSETRGAPIVFEEDPNYSTLICRVEHTQYLGTPVTNFSLIKPGALHRANGGYLLLEIRKLKHNLDAWEALKTALFTNLIQIKPIEHEIDAAVRPISLDPMPIPLNVKVILLGDRNKYYVLCQNDPDFLELFKVAVDFDEQIDRNKKNINLYARLVATIVQKHKLKPFHSSAVAAIIDFSTRIAEDVEKLSTYIREVEDLIMESNYWSSIHNKKHVDAEDVKYAIDAQIHRMDRVRDLYHEDIIRDFIIIKTSGKTIGQVNCLSVRRVGNFSFGHPTRVTARVRLGHGKLIDIQREIRMAGPMHSKAGLTIANFIASRFNRDHMFSLTASIAFEQVYCWTDGDSASVAELCALLSALAEVPLKQTFAITGSIDQYGEVQAIGGVNEKIEGFFDVCKSRGLNGTQGVIIPAVNIKNLMLREDIVEAAKESKFHIYPIKTIDEALLLLTGLPANETDDNGNYLEKMLYRQIEERLLTFSLNRAKKNK